VSAVNADAFASGVLPGLGAVVLCGGKSTRMGQAKAWLPFGGEPLLARVVARIAEAASPIVVVAAPDQEVPPLPAGASVVRDAVSGRGPLQGILAGLGALEGRAEAAFVSSTDAPFLDPALIRRLEELRRDGDHDVAVPRAQGHHHPLAAVYRISVRGVVKDLLDRDMRRPFFVFERSRTRFADEADLLAGDALRAADPHLWSLRNINTPEDYESALRDAAALSSARCSTDGRAAG
jgi:molybdopterin-guanine dinucleotide biosynthesis protein A